MAASRPIIAVHSSWGAEDAWVVALAQAAPDFEVRPWSAIADDRHGHSAADRDRVVACAVWEPPPSLFTELPRLAVIHSLGAGLDHLWALGSALPDLPVLRLVDPMMTQRMAHYVLGGVLLFQRRFHAYGRQQAEERWLPLAQPDAGQTTVGLLGLGVMGRASADLLKAVGFRVAGWSRSAQRIDGVTCFVGADGLREVARRSDVLVNLLPLTAETRGVLAGPLFTAMRPGSYLVNAGRGDHLVAKDLISALDEGRVAGALLDVFATEPLPTGDPLWSHPSVLVTPHVAAISHPPTAAGAMIDGIRAVLRGERPANLASRERGY